jgi:hypothetical protein
MRRVSGITHYCLGAASVAAGHMAIQDWMGLQGYLEQVATHWIALPWWLGAGLAVACWLLSAGLEYADNRRTCG